MRIVRFGRSLLWLWRRPGLRTWRNARALWIQSDPEWVAKLPTLDLTDEEWEIWARTMGSQ